MSHPVLGRRLIEISEALLTIVCSNPRVIMGNPDDMKLRSSMTLFHAACPQISIFKKVLDKFYDGEEDPKTIKILSKM